MTQSLSRFMLMQTDLLPSHKSWVRGGVGWGFHVHVHVHTSSTLTSPVIFLRRYVRGTLGVSGVGWGGVLTFMYMFIHHRWAETRRAKIASCRSAHFEDRNAVRVVKPQKNIKKKISCIFQPKNDHIDITKTWFLLTCGKGRDPPGCWWVWCLYPHYSPVN